MKRVFAVSPFRGSTPAERIQNEATARIFCRAIIDAGHAPFAPHLLYPRLGLSEEPADRERGMSAGACWLRVSDEAWVLGKPMTWSEGMRDEIRVALDHNIRIRIWELRDGALAEILIDVDKNGFTTLLDGGL